MTLIFVEEKRMGSVAFISIKDSKKLNIYNEPTKIGHFYKNMSGFCLDFRLFKDGKFLSLGELSKTEIKKEFKKAIKEGYKISE
jgi:hypothetical protein